MSTKKPQTTLVKKLGIKQNDVILLYQPLKNYFELLHELPTDIQIEHHQNKESADFTHLFCTTQKELDSITQAYKSALKKNGQLWVSWPKASSSINTDLNGNIIRHHFLNNGLVDIKVAAINEHWSGHKFVYRLKDR
ncbi:MAG: DUF3052 domain-containing protein [Reichenbachiella sp.]